MEGHGETAEEEEVILTKVHFYRRKRRVTACKTSLLFARLIIVIVRLVRQTSVALDIPVLCRLSARPCGPRAAVRASPLQHLEVAILRRSPARPPVPRATVRARPLQHRENSAPCRAGARILVPRTAVCARPLQYLKVPALRRARACVCVPQASRSRAPTVAPRGDRPLPPSRTSTSSTGSRSRAPTAVPNAATQHVIVSHGQPSARNSFNFSSCPLLAAAAQRYS